MTKESIATKMQVLQDEICQRIEKLDGNGVFAEDRWNRDEGGGGKTRILRNGNVVEKGGVNFSEVFGSVTPMMRNSAKIDADQFYATGVSIVLHPNHPHVPIIHMNVRYFELSNGKYWFGGGIDLTPHYVVGEQAQSFHHRLKVICDRYSSEFYPRFKDWADDYFFIPHRNETRGVGGIFFDHLTHNDQLSKEQIFHFCMELGNNFSEIYEEQVVKGITLPFSEREKKWMNLRRGRYVEFNLTYDRGTKFGLYSGGRTESILMSLPERADWEYNYIPELGSKERSTLKMLRKGVDWVQAQV